jgi:hypothetical protein
MPNCWCCDSRSRRSSPRTPPRRHGVLAPIVVLFCIGHGTRRAPSRDHRPPTGEQVTQQAGNLLRGTAMGLSWTCRPPTVDPALPGAAPGMGQISLSPAHQPGGSHSQMEGFQAEDRHNPLPHIALLTIALKSAYRNTARSCLLILLLSCGNSWSPAAGNDGFPGCCASSLGVAGLREVCYRGKGSCGPGQMIAGLQALPA